MTQGRKIVERGLLLLVLILILTGAQVLKAEQVDIGISESSTTPGLIEIKMRPDFLVSGALTMTNIVYTVRWDDASVVLTPGFVYPYFIQPQGPPVLIGGYYYQIFATVPFSPIGTDILPGEERLISSFTFTGGSCTSLEIINDAWTSSNNGDVYFELQGYNKTGIIYEPTVSPIPAVAASNSGPICAGEDVNLYETGGEATSWSWSSDGSATFSSATAQNPVASGAVNGEIFKVVISDGTCSDSATTTVTVNPIPAVAASNGGPICAGEDVNLYEAGNEATSWSWSSNGSATFDYDTAQNPVVSGAVDGEIFKVVISDGTCIDSATTTVTVNPIPAVAASNGGAICSYESLNLFETSGNAQSWEWTTNASANITNTTDQNPIATNVTDGEIFTVTIIDINGCAAAATTTSKIDSEADLSLIKTIDNSSPNMGTNVVFTVTVLNSGPCNATGVSMKDILPSGYLYVTDNGGTSYSFNTGIWDIGNLAVNADTSLQITATVLANGNYENYAQVETSDQDDPDSNPGDDSTTDDDDDRVLGVVPNFEGDISGTVFNDLNRLTDGTVNGTGTDAKGLYANLVDPVADTVIASVQVNTNGTYTFTPSDGVTENTTFEIILTTVGQTVGSSLTTAILPAKWISTGEHIGADPGDDGTVDSKLTVSTTVSEGVSEANFGIVEVPDVTPIITVVPNVMHGVTNFYITVKVTELNSINTFGDIIVRIPKDTRWVLDGPYNTGLTDLGGTPLNNSVWSYTPGPNNHIFTTTSVISAGGFSIYGFNAVWDGGQTRGILTITSQIDSWSGGEERIDNNVDAEKLDYFID